MNRALSMPPAEVVARTQAQFVSPANKGWRPWAALRRMLDRDDPSYRD